MLIGIVGWRGMVGSVLIQRMLQEEDFNYFETRFFSTSNVGGKVPETIQFRGSRVLADAFSAGYVKARFQMKPHRPGSDPVYATGARVQNGCFEGHTGDVTHEANGEPAYYYLTIPLTDLYYGTYKNSAYWWYFSDGTPIPNSAQDDGQKKHKKRCVKGC